MPHMIRGAKRVSKCEKCQHTHERQVRMLHTLTMQQTRTEGEEVKILVGAGPRGETFARAVHRKEAKFEDLELLLKVLQTRYGNIPVYCDQEECLREVVRSTARRLGLPTRVTAIEQGQANGRAEQRVRALGERSKILVEDVRRRGVEIILDHLVAQWTVRHAEWIQNFLVKSDGDMSDGGTRKISRLMKHTPETKHRAMLLDFWSEFFFEAKSTMTTSQDWALGYKDLCGIKVRGRRKSAV